MIHNASPDGLATGEVVGIFEIAQMAGVTPAAVANWRARHAGFPVPVSDLKSGPVFKVREIRNWLDQRRSHVSTRDPHYQRILDGLARLSNGDLFEKCVCDLLRAEHPTLVPVPGGDDAGMDGAAVEKDGGILLVATVGKDVIGNVTRNLESHLTAGGDRRRVLVATSQELTRRRCDNIKERVHTLGFEIAHYPYTQEAIANRLYHNSRWCRDLLGITTPPSALSKVSRFLRPLRDLPLIGRDEDLAWLRDTPGDRLIEGQPGHGKTYLEKRLVDDGIALFVTNDNPDAIVQAVRDQQPQAVVVEDAHLRQDTLRALQRFREESGVEYDIVADSWPGQADDIRSLLFLDSVHVRKLRPLASEQIVELINAAGIFGPPELMHQLVRQSLGSPGRAALLAYACLVDGVSEVWNGETLARWVGTTTRRLVGVEALQILAGLAIGGKRGMPIDAIAKLLGVGEGAIRHRIAELAASGVIYEVNENTVAVLPEQLRWVLVRDHFFRPIAPLPYREFLSNAPACGDSLSTIIRAKAIGADVPLTDLLELLEECNDRKAWETFVWADRRHADIVLNRYPDRVLALSEPLVHRLPERAIPAILQRVESPPKEDSPGVKQIKEWIRTAMPGRDQAVLRRRILSVALEDWFTNGKDFDVGLALLPAVLRPGFEDHLQDPGKPHTFTIRRGPLQLPELREVAVLWQNVFHMLEGKDLSDWRPILRAIDQWVYPGRLPAALPPEYVELFETTAVQMLRDIASIAGHRPGMLAEVRERAEHLKVELDIRVDRVFAALFPQEPLSKGWRTRQERQAAAVRILADQWSQQEPMAVASKLAEVIHEAKVAGITHPDHTEYLCQILAKDTTQAVTWIDSLLVIKVQPENVRPFLEQAFSKREEGWIDRAISCLRHPLHASVGISVLLRNPGLDVNLVNEVVRESARYPHLVRYLCHHGQVPHEYVLRLLQQSSAEVSEAAAVGVWECEPEGAIPPTLKSVWESAVMDHVAKEYDLHQMLEHDRNLAFKWLTDRAQRNLTSFRVEDTSIALAASLLTNEQREQVLRRVLDVFNARHIVKHVVGDSADLYRQLLADPSREFAHLAPLRGKPDKSWASLALIALDMGVSVEDIAYSANSGGGAFVGSLSSHHVQQAEEWKELEAHDDRRIREVARLGREACLAEAERWKRGEDKEEFAEMYL